MDPAEDTKFALLKRIFRIAEEQRGALEADRLQRFEALLDERQGLMEALLSAAPGTRPENVIEFPRRGQGEDDAIAIEALIKGIVEIDQQNGESLRAAMSEVARALGTLAEGRRVAQRYWSVPERRPRLERRG